MRAIHFGHERRRQWGLTLMLVFAGGHHWRKRALVPTYVLRLAKDDLAAEWLSWQDGATRRLIRDVTVSALNG